MPPEYGLYAATLAGVGYMIFGGSRHLFFGPDAAPAARIRSYLRLSSFTASDGVGRPSAVTGGRSLERAVLSLSRQRRYCVALTL